LLASHAVDAADGSYLAESEKWRQERETRLRAEDGWLSVSGLSWLKPGDTRFGSDPAMEIVLPDPAPKFAGIFRYDGQRTQVIPAGDTALLVNGTPVLNASLVNSDAETGKSDDIRVAGLEMLLIQRGERLGVRIKDKNSKYRREFLGCDWFPIDPQYRVEARYTAYAKPIVRRMPTVLDGVEEDQEAIGTLDFVLRGRSLKLEALKSGLQLYLVFRDQTANQTTYGAARFLYATVKDGKAVLDFNKAYNPPCAFNPFTTCPLPVKQNILPVAIEAGEKKYKGDH
jgi:uncharacterized protein (DUF1684 family)